MRVESLCTAGHQYASDCPDVPRGISLIRAYQEPFRRPVPLLLHPLLPPTINLPSSSSSSSTTTTTGQGAILLHGNLAV